MKIRSAVLFTSVLAFAGCGDSGPSHGHSHSPESHASDSGHVAGAAGFVETKDGVTIVHLSGNDRMKYNLEAFTVKAGSEVKVIFKNEGKMPKAAMGHNVVFLKSDVDSNAFVTAAAKARDNDYIPADLIDKVIAYTKLLGPGETDIIEFTAPMEAGECAFVCSFPAHLYAGMVGVMTVED